MFVDSGTINITNIKITTSQGKNKKKTMFFNLHISKVEKVVVIAFCRGLRAVEIVAPICLSSLLGTTPPTLKPTILVELRMHPLARINLQQLASTPWN